MPQSCEPRIPRETIELIKQMAIENPDWGLKKIHGELLKLEIVVNKRTIQKYMKQVRKNLVAELGHFPQEPRP